MGHLMMTIRNYNDSHITVDRSEMRAIDVKNKNWTMVIQCGKWKEGKRNLISAFFKFSSK